MPNVNLWSNVQVSVQSALAAADTITGITKASPGVVTATAHGMSNGDYVKLTVLGMREVDSRVFRISAVTTDTFTLEAENTTDYATFISGSAEKITFGINMTTAVGLDGSGGEFDFIDTTTIHGNAKTQVPGLPNAATYNFDNLWDPADAALAALNTASKNRAQRAVLFHFAGGTGPVVAFNSYIGCSLLPVGSAQDKVLCKSVATMHGAPSIYTA